MMTAAGSESSLASTQAASSSCVARYARYNCKVFGYEFFDRRGWDVQPTAEELAHCVDPRKIERRCSESERPSETELRSFTRLVYAYAVCKEDDGDYVVYLIRRRLLVDGTRDVREPDVDRVTVVVVYKSVLETMAPEYEFEYSGTARSVEIHGKYVCAATEFFNLCMDVLSAAEELSFSSDTWCFSELSYAVRTNAFVWDLDVVNGVNTSQGTFTPWFAAAASDLDWVGPRVARTVRSPSLDTVAYGFERVLWRAQRRECLFFILCNRPLEEMTGAAYERPVQLRFFEGGMDLPSETQACVGVDMFGRSQAYLTTEDVDALAWDLLISFSQDHYAEGARLPVVFGQYRAALHSDGVVYAITRRGKLPLCHAKYASAFVDLLKNLLAWKSWWDASRQGREPRAESTRAVLQPLYLPPTEMDDARWYVYGVPQHTAKPVLFYECQYLMCKKLYESVLP